MGVSEMDVTNLLLGLISGLLGILIWVAQNFATRILNKLAVLDRRQAECVARFADDQDNRTAHDRIFQKVDNHEGRIVRLETINEGDCGK